MILNRSLAERFPNAFYFSDLNMTRNKYLLEQAIDVDRHATTTVEGLTVAV